MVKPRKKINRKRGLKQGENKRPEKAKKIRASTRHGYTEEHLSP
jgi:hypothetical protein